MALPPPRPPPSPAAVAAAAAALLGVPARRHLAARHLAAGSAGAAAAAAAAPAVARGAAVGEEGAATRDLFLGPGIEGSAVSMRRRVQLGMGLEFAGTQAANLFLAHGGGMDSFTTFFIENSNALVALHIYAVWRYAGFLRDTLLARHVTRIALISPHQEGQAPRHVELLVETGPWQRRLRLALEDDAPAAAGVEQGRGWAVPGGGSSAGEPADGAPASLGELLRAGFLHVDRGSSAGGAAVGGGGGAEEPLLLDGLLARRYVIVGEEVATDVPAAARAFVPPDRLAFFLADAAADGAAARRLLARPGLRPLLQCHGGRVMGWYGLAALAMGLASAAVWCSPARRR